MTGGASSNKDSTAETPKKAESNQNDTKKVQPTPVVPTIVNYTKPANTTQPAEAE